MCAGSSLDVLRGEIGHHGIAPVSSALGNPDDKGLITVPILKARQYYIFLVTKSFAISTSERSTLRQEPIECPKIFGGAASRYGLGEGP
jgi:hypothetical protein